MLGYLLWSYSSEVPVVADASQMPKDIGRDMHKSHRNSRIDQYLYLSKVRCLFVDKLGFFVLKKKCLCGTVCLSISLELPVHKQGML